MPSHLSQSYGGYSGSDNSSKGGSKIPGLSAIEDFWEEGKKIVMRQFKATEYALDEKIQDDRYAPEGGYDLDTLPEIAKDQQEKGWPRHEAKRNTYGGYEGSKYGRDERSDKWDNYAKEIFETKTDGFGGFTKSKSEILAENAKEVKKKWEQVESNFLEFDKPQTVESKPKYADFADFEAFGKGKEQKSTTTGNTRPRIFDDPEPKPQKNPVFEEWWDDNKMGVRKEKSLPSTHSDQLNGIFMEQPKKSATTTADFGTLFQSQPNQSKPTPPDWLNSNPFDDKGGRGGNLMDF